MKTSQILIFAGIMTACSTTSPTPVATTAAETTPAVAGSEQLPKTLEEAVAKDYRSPQNLPRDIYRHPVETLRFFGIKPSLTVIEISPGAGWYTEILAPYLSNQGRYIAAIVPPEKGEYSRKAFDSLEGWAKGHPEVKMTYSNFSPPTTVDLGPNDSADLVLTFRNVHNWMNNDAAEKAFAEFFRVLKPGGVLGVVEHRQNEKGAVDPKGKSGYVKESEVIAFATKAGFKLEEKSEINANPKDTKDYPEGVWTLPPTLALKDKDRAKYLAIGESDRMTLRFVKPVTRK